MSIVGDALNKIFETIQDITIFFFSYTLIVFIAGAFFGIMYQKSEVFWYPLYGLAAVMLIKVLIDLGRARKKSGKKE